MDPLAAETSVVLVAVRDTRITRYLLRRPWDPDMASLAPGLSLACQQAMSATKIYMLVLMRVLTLCRESP